MNNKGISTIIAVAIIVLLAISSVGIFWTFLSKSEDKFERGLQADCFKLNLKPLKCEIYGHCGYSKGQSGYEAEILVRREAGKGDLNALRFLFKKETSIAGGIVDYADLGANSLKELETRNYREAPFRVSVPGSAERTDSISVIAIIGKNNFSCQTESTSVSCNEINTAPAGNFTPSLTTNSRYENYCCQYPLNVSSCVTFDKLKSDCIAHGCSANVISSPLWPSSFDCTDTPSPCGTYSSFGQSICETHGCSWNQNSNACTGNPDSCDSFEKPRDKKVYCCDSVPGNSNYNPLQYPHCVAPYPNSFSCAGASQILCSTLSGCYWNGASCINIPCNNI